MTTLAEIEAVGRREAISCFGCLPNDAPHERWSESHVREVDLCRDFIRSAPSSTFPRRQWSKLGSYGLKHDVEHQSGAYIQNGCFIVAAVLEGLDIERHGINAYFRRPTTRSEPSQTVAP